MEQIEYYANKLYIRVVVYSRLITYYEMELIKYSAQTKVTGACER